MPCFSIETSNVQFLEASTDPVLLKLALEAMGYSVTLTEQGQLSFARPQLGVTGTYDRGRIETRGSIDLNEVRRAYGEKVVEAAAHKQGWTLGEWRTNPKTGNRTVKVTRRG